MGTSMMAGLVIEVFCRKFVKMSILCSTEVRDFDVYKLDVVLCCLWRKLKFLMCLVSVLITTGSVQCR